MKLTHLTLACALAAGGSAALAQSDAGSAGNARPSRAAAEVGQKAKSGVHSLGQKTKNAWNTVKNKAQEVNAKAKHNDQAAGEAGTMGAGPSREQASGSAASGSRQQRMDEAYANYKSSTLNK